MDLNSIEAIGAALDEVRGPFLEKHGILPSSSIGGSGAIYILGALVALGGKIQISSMKKKPNRGITDKFVKPPSRPRDMLGHLTSSVAPHINKVSSRGGSFSERFYEKLHRMISQTDLPVRFRVSDNFDYAKGMYDIKAIYEEIWRRRPKDVDLNIEDVPEENNES